MKKAVLAYAPDGAELANKIRELLRDEHIELSTNISEPIESWETVVILFIITPKAAEEPGLISIAQEATNRGLPLIPVVDDLKSYKFDQLPPSLVALRSRNAMDIRAREGQHLVTTVRRHLGLDPFGRSKKVFISYRRSDGTRQAETIREYLKNRGFEVFTDVHDIEGGEVVQEIIGREIEDKDLVLLIDSPDAATSSWVATEITEALNGNIPVCAVSLQSVMLFPFYKDMTRIEWDESDPHNLERIEVMLSQSIALRDSFDNRLDITLGDASRLKKLKLERLDRRRILIRRKNRRFLLEYENATISLERLHRLYLSYKRAGRVRGAAFVSGDHPLLGATQEAIYWARGRSSLEVVCLSNLYSVLDQIFPGAE